MTRLPILLIRKPATSVTAQASGPEARNNSVRIGSSIAMDAMAVMAKARAFDGNWCLMKAISFVPASWIRPNSGERMPSCVIGTGMRAKGRAAGSPSSRVTLLDEPEALIPALAGRDEGRVDGEGPLV